MKLSVLPMLLLALVVSGSAMAQQRPAVVVAAFTNTAGVATGHWWRDGVGEHLGEVLSNELHATGYFTVIERQRMSAPHAGQRLSTAEQIHEANARATDVTGTGYLVVGAVSAYNEFSIPNDDGMTPPASAGREGRRDAYVAMDLRVIGSETFEVVYSRTVEGRSSRGGVNLRGHFRSGLGGTLSHSENQPANKAIRAALVEATDYLNCVLAQRTRRCLARYEYPEHTSWPDGRGLLDLD